MTVQIDELGPVDWLLVEFPGSKFHGEIAPALDDLVERGIIRVLDLLVLKKDTDGSLEAFELADLDESEIGQLRAYEAELATLLGEDDVPRSLRPLSRGARPRASSTKTRGLPRSPRPCAEPVGSWWPTDAFPSRHYWPRARSRTQEVHEMPLGRRRLRRAGLIAGGAAVVAHRRRGKRDDRQDDRDDRQDDRDDRQDDRQDDREDRQDDREDRPRFPRLRR